MVVDFWRVENIKEPTALAVNIAIIPNTRWLEWSEAVNALLPQAESNITFGKTCVPHITLAMGVVMLDDHSKLANALPEIPEEFRLNPAGISTHDRPDTLTWWLDVEASEELLSLQKAVQSALKPFLQDEVNAQHFAGDQIQERSVEYVKSFLEHPYQPHITLGFGDALPVLPSLPSTSRGRMEIWHLGPHCTCYGRLWNSVNP